MIKGFFLSASWLFWIAAAATALALAVDPLANWGLRSLVVARLDQAGTIFHIVFVIILYAAVLPAVVHAKRLWMPEDDENIAWQGPPPVDPRMFSDDPAVRAAYEAEQKAKERERKQREALHAKRVHPGLFFPAYLVSSFGLAFLSMLSIRYAAGVTEFNSVLFLTTCLLQSLVFTFIFLGALAVVAVALAASAPPPLHFILIPICMGLLVGSFFLAYFLAF